MKFVCRNHDCPGLGIQDSGCPKCGFVVTPQGVVGFAWKSFKGSVMSRLGVRCPTCGGVIPAFQSTCPGCRATLTVERVLEETMEPARNRAMEMAVPTKTKVAIFQWSYLFFSTLLFCGLFGQLDGTESTSAILPAVLSVFYLAVVLSILAWFIPRATIQALNRRAPKRIKLALLINFITGAIALNLAVKEWWARASLLAVVILGIGIGFWIFWRLLWPMLAELQQSLHPQSERPFDPQAPQGRRVETE